MPRPVLRRHSSGVSTEHHPDEGPATAPSVFLVELTAPGSPSSDIDGMHKALMYSVSRLHARGVAITAWRSVLLPRDSRCLCLLLAAEEETVALARDAAGVSAASIHRAVPLPAPRGGDGWSRAAEPDAPAVRDGA